MPGICTSWYNFAACSTNLPYKLILRRTLFCHSAHRENQRKNSKDSVISPGTVRQDRCVASLRNISYKVGFAMENL